MNNIWSALRGRFSNKSLGSLIRRFPLPILQILLLGILLCLDICFDNLTDKKLYAVSVYYLSAGALLSLSLRLWSEDVSSRKKSLSVQTILQVLWLLNAVYLWQTADFSISLFFGNASICTFLAVSVFTASFLRARNDLPLWNFTVRLLSLGALSYLIGLVLLGGIALLLTLFEKLFGCDIPTEAYECFTVVCLSTLPTLLWLYQMPLREEKVDYSIRIVPILNFFARYLLTPLVLIYIAVLYIYAVSILFRGELPNGWVSWPVSILMLGIFLTVLILYPSRIKAAQSPFDKRMSRLLPLLTLPLLVLMSVAIGRRISDYGITYLRLYILAFNIWCYGMCVYLYFTRSRRILWIPLSFSLIFVLTSVGPWNFSAVTLRTLNRQLESIWARSAYKPTRPMNEKAFERFLKQLPAKERKTFDGKLSYIRAEFNDTLSQSFVTRSVPLWSPADTSNEKTYWNDISEAFINLPSQCVQIGDLPYIYKKVSLKELRQNNITIEKIMGKGKNDCSIKFTLSVDKLKQLSDTDGRGMPFLVPTQKENVKVLVTSYSLTLDDDSNGSQAEGAGYLNLSGYVVVLKEKNPAGAGTEQTT